MCLGNISKGFTVYNMKRKELNGYVYDCIVGYNTIDVVNIHKYLMKKHNIKSCSNLLSKIWLRC